MNKTIARLGALAAMALTASLSLAFYDQQIVIDRALNSPTVNVKYSGARAAMVEIRLNGVSLGTRTVSSAKTSGEISFTLDLNALTDGDNLIEIRLYDKSGKLVGTETSVITTDEGASAPVRLTYPKMAATVQGNVDIKVGFGREMRNAYVSFFVDNQFKSMTNTSPFTFSWDTVRETNGWHELEAMLVDDTSATFRTRKVRVFVNNPGGKTERVTQPEPPTTAVGNASPATAKNTGAKTTPLSNTVSNTVKNVVTPAVAGLTSPNKVQPQTGDRTSVKAAPLANTSVTGGRVVTPPAPKGVKSPKPVMSINLTPTNTVAPVANAAVGRISIDKGVRLPNIGTFSIVLSGKMVNFDVQPRVQDGIALAPVRHLLEGAGGKVDWDNQAKIVQALTEGKTIRLSIGDKVATIGELSVELELAPFIEKGRTIIPISFLKDSLNVNIEYDAKTGHVLITKNK